MSRLTDLIRGQAQPQVYLPAWIERLAAQGRVVRRIRLGDRAETIPQL
jgi:hypothetical protein